MSPADLAVMPPLPLTNDLFRIGEILRRHLGQRPCSCPDALAGRSRRLDAANYDLDGRYVLQTKVRGELDCLPVDHTFDDLCIPR
jgi:hypothetical protein